MKEVDYNYDDPAIPMYQKETRLQIIHKKMQFFNLSRLICSEIPFNTHLDVGCGSGFLVTAMRKNKKESFGCEVGYMFHNGLLPKVSKYVYEKSIFQLSELPYQYDLVSSLEVLEHLYAENFYRNDLNDGIISLINKSKKYIFLTMPILTKDYCPYINWNDNDPKLWARLLKREEIPLTDKGTPILGHVSLATEAWWRIKLESFGLERCKIIEDNINTGLFSIDPGLLDWWHIFVYSK